MNVTEDGTAFASALAQSEAKRSTLLKNGIMSKAQYQQDSDLKKALVYRHWEDMAIFL